jgi:hypothetical protein
MRSIMLSIRFRPLAAVTLVIQLAAVGLAGPPAPSSPATTRLIPAAPRSDAPDSAGIQGGGNLIPRGKSYFRSLGSSRMRFRKKSKRKKGFFGRGSKPFQGDVSLVPIPLGVFEGRHRGDANLILCRDDDLDLPPPFPRQGDIPVTLVNIKLITRPRSTSTSPGPASAIARSTKPCRRCATHARTPASTTSGSTGKSC